MSMKPEQENFDQLRRLLKLKRYEQPPPGYFNDFSTQVIAQIKAGPKVSHDGMLEWLYFEAPWLQRLFGLFETKPAVAWGFGMAVCAILLSGIVYSETTEYDQVATVPVLNEPTVRPVATATPVAFGSQPVPAILVDATNPVEPAQPSLFDQIPFAPSVPAGFQAPEGFQQQ